MKKSLRLFALASAVFLAACAKPVPPEQKDFVGLWEAPEMRLLITADGSLDYKRIKGGGSTSINAPIQEFTANGFSAGLGPLKTEFKVSQRPHAVERKVDLQPVGPRAVGRGLGALEQAAVDQDAGRGSAFMRTLSN